jgi:hypothetical protein
MIPTGRLFRVSLLLWSILSALLPFDSSAAHRSGTPKTSDTLHRDGRHDFDFHLGTWRTQIKRLLNPLTGSTAWVDLDGTVTIRNVWDGAQLEEIEADGAQGHFEGLTLFLYNPEARQWSLSWSNSNDGTLGLPSTGEFTNGRGEFIDQETYNGRAILVKMVWSEITPDSHRAEQSFSADGGKTWEPNFVANLTRKEGAPNATATSTATTSPAGKTSDGRHDFDFDFGVWKTHTSRLKNPLSGSTTWTEMNGRTVVRKVWDGRANLAQLESDGPAGHLELLSLRLFDPQAHEWSLHFATSNVGVPSVPMVGKFSNGRGEFIDQEQYNGKTILVKFTMISLSPNTARSEQAFSADGGKTWETNWINNYTRISQ